MPFVGAYTVSSRGPWGFASVGADGTYKWVRPTVSKEKAQEVMQRRPIEWATKEDTLTAWLREVGVDLYAINQFPDTTVPHTVVHVNR